MNKPFSCSGSKLENFRTVKKSPFERDDLDGGSRWKGRTNIYRSFYTFNTFASRKTKKTQQIQGKPEIEKLPFDTEKLPFDTVKATF